MKYNIKPKSYQFVVLIMMITFIIFSSPNLFNVYAQEEDNQDTNLPNEEINITQEQRDNKTFYYLDD